MRSEPGCAPHTFATTPCQTSANAWIPPTAHVRCGHVLAPLLLTLLLAPPAAATHWRAPVAGPVTRAFDLRGDPFEAGAHRGADFAAARGATVRAPCSGRVEVAGRVGTSGRVVTVLCGRWRASVMPLAEVAVEPGAGRRARRPRRHRRALSRPPRHPPRRPPRRRPLRLRRPAPLPRARRRARAAAGASARPRAAPRTRGRCGPRARRVRVRRARVARGAWRLGPCGRGWGCCSPAPSAAAPPGGCGAVVRRRHAVARSR